MSADVKDAKSFVASVVKDAVYEARNAGMTIDIAAEAASDALTPLVYSDVSRADGPLEWVEPHDGEPAYQRHAYRRLTWQELCEEQRERIDVLSAFETFVRDLDRCQHGRHEGDTCTFERGCGGPSKGNVWMQDMEERRLSNDDDEHPAHFGLGHAMSGDSYFLRRPPEPGALPVALKRRYRDADGKVAVVETIELGER